LPTQHGDTYDHHAVEYEFADGCRLFAQTRQISGCWGVSTLHVHGTEGTAEVGHGRIRGKTDWRFRENVANPYQVELDVFTDAIRQNKPHNEVDSAARTTMGAILGRMASYSGQKITWDEALESQVSLAPDRYDFDATPPVVAVAGGNYPVAMPGISKAF
jgi:hypothetical protein